MDIVKKFSMILLLLFLLIPLYSQQNEYRNIALIKKYDENLILNDLNQIKLLFDITDHYLFKQENLILRNFDGIFESYNISQLTNYAFSHGLNAFYFFEIKLQSKGNIIINTKIYNSIGDILFDQFYMIDYNKQLSLTEDLQKKWLEFISESLKKIPMSKKKWVSNKNVIKKSNQFIHDFPFFSFGLFFISTKFYFDERMHNNANKIFSVSPLDLRLSFFPLKYMEVGLFCKFDFNNMVYRYYNGDEIKFLQTDFLLFYGLYIGLSFFNETTHYSLGFQFYNLFYDVSKMKNFNRPENLNGYFLPQFSFYQRIDFKIFKFIYYTIFMNLKTIPMFIYEDKYLYSSPFYYDFLVLEISLIGLTLQF